MIRASILVTTLMATVAALVLVTGSAMADVGEVGVDADVTGNEADSLGPIDTCVEVAEGDTVDIDVYVKGAEEIIAFRAWVRYDPAVLEVSDRDTDLFLTTSEDTGVIDQSDATPDSDGQYEMQAVNASESSAGASGDGVLGRITFTAVGTGTSTIDLTSHDINNDGVIDRGIYFADFDGEHPGDEDGDTYYDGTLRGAVVAVGESCDDAPSPPGIDDDGDGSVLWIAIGVIAVVVLAVVGGGLALRRRKPAEDGPN